MVVRRWDNPTVKNFLLNPWGVPIMFLGIAGVLLGILFGFKL
jgi:hypothetical protein